MNENEIKKMQSIFAASIDNEGKHLSYYAEKAADEILSGIAPNLLLFALKAMEECQRLRNLILEDS